MPQPSSNAQLVSLPTWLTKDYLQDKLRKRYNEPNLKVTNLKIKPASSKGDNYASTMLRVNVKFISEKFQNNIQEESLIVKSTSLNDVQIKILNEYGVYEREMKMYDEILPKLNQILEGNGYQTKIFPETINVDYQNASIIFEDLNESGFVMANRLERLDMKHTQIALTKLAKFHAAAAVLQERNPQIFAQNFDRGIFNRYTQGFKPMVLGVLSALLRYIEKQAVLKEQYYEKLYNLKEHIMEYCERAFDVNESHFMTLTHGDYWHTNMMFKYKNGSTTQPIDQCPLDFQCCVWASPAIDLQYFFNTSLQEDLRLHHQPALIKFYYDILEKTLRDLEFKGFIPSLFELRIQIELRSFYGLFAALIFQPIMICPESEDSDFINLISDTEAGIRFKNSIFKNTEVQKYLECLLPIFDQNGLLNDMDSVKC